jgi:hypothetical protein
MIFTGYNYVKIAILMAAFTLVQSCAAFNMFNSSKENGSIDGAFKIGAVNPSSSSIGGDVTIGGGTFLKGLSVEISGTKAKIKSLKHNKVVITIPEGVEPGLHVLEFFQDNHSNDFEYMILNSDGSLPGGKSAITLKTEKVAHGVRASVSASASGTQVINADKNSNLAGGSASFPAGSLAFDTNVSMTSGANIATNDIANSLGVANGFSNIGISAAITAENMDALTNPYALSLPVPAAAGLAIDPRDRIAILSRYQKSKNGEIFLAIHKRDSLKIVDDNVEFYAEYFGTYQVVMTGSPVVQSSEISEASVVTEEIVSEETDDDEVDEEENTSIPLFGQTGAFHQRGVMVTSFLGNSQDTQVSSAGINSWFLKTAPVAGAPTDLTVGYIPKE